MKPLPGAGLFQDEVDIIVIVHIPRGQRLPRITGLQVEVSIGRAGKVDLEVKSRIAGENTGEDSHAVRLMIAVQIDERDARAESDVDESDVDEGDAFDGRRGRDRVNGLRSPERGCAHPEKGGQNQLDQVTGRFHREPGWLYSSGLSGGSPVHGLVLAAHIRTGVAGDAAGEEPDATQSRRGQKAKADRGRMVDWRAYQLSVEPIHAVEPFIHSHASREPR